MTARSARAIRKRSQVRSQNPNGLGVSELFLASRHEASVILAAGDTRLKMYLLGFAEIPRRNTANPEAGLSSSCVE